MGKTIKLEAFIAWPPTSMCEETIKVMEEIVRRHPDELRLLIFKRGVDHIPDDATEGMKNLMMKGCKVPACVVNGVLFSSKVVPNPEELEARVQEVFVRTGMKEKAGS